VNYSLHLDADDCLASATADAQDGVVQTQDLDMSVAGEILRAVALSGLASSDSARVKGKEKEGGVCVKPEQEREPEIQTYTYVEHICRTLFFEPPPLLLDAKRTNGE